MFTREDNEAIARETASLLEIARRRCKTEDEFALVGRAVEFAGEAHKEVLRKNNLPYVLHPIAVAKIVVAEIGLGYKSIVSALLHDVYEEGIYGREDVREVFGDKISSMVDGLHNLKSVLDSDNTLQVRNILLSLNDDIRIVLIKLADRLHNFRTMEYLPDDKRERVLDEAMNIFIPLAHRLGLYSIKSEMENIWLYYRKPEVYNDIQARVNLNSEGRSERLESFIKPIRDALIEAGLVFEIKKRVKTPYSIWHKMQTKGVSFEEIYDLYAVRIVFDPDPSSSESERDQCFNIFEILKEIYPYKEDRLRDWVTTPRSSGYEALQCTLRSDNGKWVEVQIRTRRMDDIAERGIAAHWAYKDSGNGLPPEIDDWLLKVKDILSDKDKIDPAAMFDLLEYKRK